MVTRNRLDLLIKEVKDKYSQENFLKLRRYLNSLDLGSGGVGPQGPQGPAGPPGQDASVTLQVTIPAGNTLEVDSLTFGNFLRVHYKVNVYNVVENVYQTYDLTCSRRGNDVDYNRSSILGDSVNNISNFFVSGSDAVLEITNNELFDIIFRAEKFT